ncbi:protein DOS2-like [Quercus lobata]|uniref:BSD domain-containing protein n=1 Tax=Quercus lobata TaxID=97700 RepID=A0A7N2LX13_QUELO|nr:protein DOS2-like [Quercus lobata]
MDFFKSVFSEDPDPPQNDDAPEPNQDPNPNPNPDPDSDSDSTAIWSFVGLIKTIASKSESVIQNYRRDMEEFGSGLKKETSVIREVASRAVMDFPASLDAGTSVAQESLESVGQAIDDIGSSVWKSTAEIITHGADKLFVAAAAGSDSDSDSNNGRRLSSSSQVSDLKPYSRFDAQMRAVQCDLNTYLEEPKEEDLEEWKLGFVLEEKGKEIEDLIRENPVIEEIYENIVPTRVDKESFWIRYFYRVHKLKQAEEARAKLVKRVISRGEEEDLSWDFDDDEEENGEKNIISNNDNVALDDDKSSRSNVVENVGVKLDEKRGDSEESGRDSDVSVVSSQPLLVAEEEELGWDEIEDIGSNDENKGEGEDGVVSSSNRVDLRKRLSKAEEEEDLSWDIEDEDDGDDDDKHVKS